MTEAALRATCEELVPPLLLASPGGWRYVYDGEDPAITAERAAAITHWVEDVVPAKLRLLHDQLEPESSLPLELRAELVCAASRFIDPRKRSRSPSYSLSEWSAQERDAWTSPHNSTLASAILRLPALSPSRNKSQHNERPVADLDVALHLLQHYIKPLFSATPSSSVNAKTGRAAPPIANLVDASSRRGAPLDDEVLWKGGDVKTAQRTKTFGRTVLQEAPLSHASNSSQQDATSTRHQALGCVGVLYVCCLSIQSAALDASQSANAVDYWSEAWPLVLPPLIQVLEDPSPRFRLVGTHILADAVLGCGRPGRSPSATEDATLRYDRRLSTLLLRTGVASIFASVLDANVTYVSHELAGALFQATTEAWLQLALITTDDMYAASRQSNSAMPNVKRDGGRARYGRLCKLVDDGVLRTWAYAPSGVRADDVVGPVEVAQTEERQNGAAEDESAYEEDDVVIATMIALAELAAPDTISLGIVRYLDVCLEYLVGQLVGGLEAKVNRWREKMTQHKMLSSAPPTLSLRREACAADAIVALAKASKPSPGLKTWIARCLTSAAKCWTLLDEVLSKSDSNHYIKQILQELDELSDTLCDAQPDAFATVAERLAIMSDSAAQRLKVTERVET